MFSRILVAVDPSPSRLTSVRMAGELARLAGASVHVLHVVATTATLDTVVGLEDDAEARAILDEAVLALRDEGVKADGTLANGLLNDVPALINETAGQFGADLIVLSPHHRGVVAALFNPRVSDIVTHASHTAVLLAPDRAAATGA
ncbi:universal stress protein [Streptomyces sp. VMFN-G11Ma]|uniref:universal stress protein n=1 Tax=Streptomyces sp. VMFN-G11Ma TaxID=2135609 RepID=UPI000D3CFDE3|nr:universal stress protein [Streptomyces sp. VMFN-G11Ma]PTM83762.1 nucleotide-binding universal stress UspA family protein [Streptomyces sp. VMFN-G11Ma]